MKVLALQCANSHAFEGWFANEQDFQRQLAQDLVQCPFCADARVHKLLSAPRIQRGVAPPSNTVSESSAPQAPEVSEAGQWLSRMREWVAGSEDVGERFASEARAMHEGDLPGRAIRGVASAEETRELLSDGILVLPVPPALSEPLH